MTEDVLNKVGRRVGPLSELPEELRKQLNIGKTDELEDDIMIVLKDLEGIANIDELLVGLYRKQGMVQRRQFVANKLYRMTRTGLIAAVEGKRGVYKVM